MYVCSRDRPWTALPHHNKHMQHNSSQNYAFSLKMHASAEYSAPSSKQDNEIYINICICIYTYIDHSP